MNFHATPVSTYLCPVRGPDGEPLEKGVIQFHSEGNPSLNISGTIADGRFTLVTAFASETRSGAIPGRYRVSVTPAFDVVPQTIELNDVYEIVSGPNELIIELAE